MREGLTSERAPLYTPDERVRRDASPWTIVQGVLAPVQHEIARQGEKSGYGVEHWLPRAKRAAKPTHANEG